MDDSGDEGGPTPAATSSIAKPKKDVAKKPSKPNDSTTATATTSMTGNDRGTGAGGDDSFKQDRYVSSLSLFVLVLGWLVGWLVIGLLCYKINQDRKRARERGVRKSLYRSQPLLLDGLVHIVE